MIFPVMSREWQMRWQMRFALFSVQVGTNADGTPKKVWLEFYQVRWTGEVCYGGACMERRLLGSNEIYSYLA